MSRLGKAVLTFAVAAGVFAALAAALLIMVQAGVFVPDKSERIPLVIAAADAEKTYDGLALTCADWSIVSGKLRKDDHLQVKVYGSQLTAGESENSISVKIFDNRGRDAGKYYDLTVYAGKLTVHKCQLTFLTHSARKVYDGEPLYGEGAELSSGNLPEGYTFEAEAVGRILTVGRMLNEVAVNVFNPAHEDCTKNFEISCVPGELVVTPRVLTVETAGSVKPNDGTPLSCDVWLLPNPEELVKGERVEVEMTTKLTEVGSIANRPGAIHVYDREGNDIAFCYDFVLVLGQLIIFS